VLSSFIILLSFKKKKERDFGSIIFNKKGFKIKFIKRNSKGSQFIKNLLKIIVIIVIKNILNFYIKRKLKNVVIKRWQLKKIIIIN